MHLNAIYVYCVACVLAGLAVALGVLAGNIALLLVLVVMAGVCAEQRRRK